MDTDLQVLSSQVKSSQVKSSLDLLNAENADHLTLDAEGREFHSSTCVDCGALKYVQERIPYTRSEQQQAHRVLNSSWLCRPHLRPL